MTGGSKAYASSSTNMAFVVRSSFA